MRYYSGGIKQSDFPKAAFWLRKAAKQGHVEAQFALGVMHHKGRGVPEDNVEAYKWLHFAATGGNGKAAQYRELVAKKMTTAQIASARRLASNLNIKSTSPRKNNTNTAARRKIARIQRQLQSLGYSPEPADGIMGPKTLAAIKAFQKEEGLQVTGTISDELDTVLGSKVANQ